MATLPFLEARLTDRIARGMERSKTVPGRTMIYGPTGRLTQNYSAAYPIHKFELAPAIQYAADFNAVEALWYVVHFGSGGPYAGFLAVDYGDFRLKQSNTRLTLIAGSVYQINRVHSYSYGVVSDEFLRPIFKPDVGVVVKRTRGGAVSTATATVDTTNGQATISGHAGGDTYTCEGTFCLPVTFSDDEWTAALQGGGDGMVSVSGSIKLEEVRL